MLDLSTILPGEGALPSRPAHLTALEPVEASCIAEAVVIHLERGKSLVVGGVSLRGAGGYFVTIISFLQVKDGVLRGWTLSIGHPEKTQPDFERIDTATIPLTELPLPDLLTYFAAEVPSDLTESEVAPEKLVEIAHFVTHFISDDGPPKGIDW